MNAHTLPHAVDAFFERADGLDPVADSLAAGIAAAYRAGGDAGEAVEDVLHGRPLGHPLHPVLVEIPVGAWMTVSAMDALELLGVKGLEKGTNAVLAIGLVGAGGAVLTGWTDWHETKGLPRRIGLTHGLLNEVAALVYGASLLARLRGRRRLGQALSFGGLALIGASAYLGGHLVYKHGVGVGGPMD